MSVLIKTELKKIMDKNTLILLLFTIICASCIFFFQYQNDYDLYIDKQIEINNKSSNYYYFQIKNGQLDNETYTLFNNQIIDLSNLNSMYSSYTGVEDKEILELENKIDLRSFEISNIYDLNNTISLRGTIEEVKDRIDLFTFYKENKIEPVMNPYTPSVSYIMNEAFSGFSILSLFIIVIVLINSYNVFSEEYENTTIKQIMVLPYSRKEIYFAKFISTFIKNIIFILTPIITIICISSILYGFGMNNYTLINKNIFGFENFYQTSKQIISIVPLMLTNIYTFLIHIISLYVIMFFVSYLSNSKIIAFAFSLFLLITIIYITSQNQSLLKIFPILSYGYLNLEYSLSIYTLLSAIQILVIYAINKTMFIKRDVRC